jgi:hypothetical protein
MNSGRTTVARVSYFEPDRNPLSINAKTFTVLAASVMPFGNLFAQPELPMPECTMIIDSGFSFTHVVPLLSGKIVWNSVKRQATYSDQQKPFLIVYFIKKIGCWRQITDQSIEGARIFSSVEHDGRDLHHERR